MIITQNLRHHWAAYFCTEMYNSWMSLMGDFQSNLFTMIYGFHTTSCVFSITELWLEDRKDTASWIKIIINCESWDSFYRMFLPRLCQTSIFSVKIHNFESHNTFAAKRNNFTLVTWVISTLYWDKIVIHLYSYIIVL